MDLTKSQAEEVAKRSIGLCKEIQKLEIEGAGESTITQLTREIERDLGLLGMGIKFRLEKDEEYRTGYRILTEETVRLHMTIDTLAEKYTEIMKHADAMEKANEFLHEKLESNGIE